MLLLVSGVSAFFGSSAAQGQPSPPPKPCKILLTFDDGPAYANTKKVVETLDSLGISGVFFVQTHYLMCDKAADGTPGCSGNKVILEKVLPKHLIAIHTGSKTDHTEHWRRYAERAEDVDGDKKADGETALESDLIRAKARLAALTGITPKYVRAVKGQFTRPNPPAGHVSTTQGVRATYARQQLKHIGWDRESRDNYSKKFRALDVKLYLDRKKRITKPDGKEQIVDDPEAEPLKFDTDGPVIVLFHDRKGETASNLQSYIDTIKDICTRNNRVATFVATKADAEQVLANR